MAEFRGGTTAEHGFAEREHRELAPGIERIHAVARAVGSIAPSDWSSAVLDVIEWVETVLGPHAAREDAWLYPEIACRAGSPWATKLVTLEDKHVRRKADDFERHIGLAALPDRTDGYGQPHGTRSVVRPPSTPQEE
jgi:hypothetical protein